MSDRKYPGNIELHIKQLVLHGFTNSDQEQIGEAIRMELTRQLSEHGLSDTLQGQGGAGGINAGTVQIGQGNNARFTGTQVARAVYGRMNGERRGSHNKAGRKA